MTERTPIDVTWEVSRHCYLRCLHCSAMPTHPASPVTDHDPMSHHITNWIHGHPLRSLELSGGEPMWNPATRAWWREESLALLERQAVERLVIQTCGIGIQEHISHPTSIPFEGSWEGIVLQFSVHSCDCATFDLIAGHQGAFIPVVNSMICAMESGAEVEANIVPMAQNMLQLGETVEWLIGCGVRRVNILRLMEHGWAADTHSWLRCPGDLSGLLADLAGKHPEVRLSRAYDGGCGVGVDKLYVDAKGWVYPCVALRHSSAHRLGHYSRGTWPAYLRMAGEIGCDGGTCCGPIVRQHTPTKVECTLYQKGDVDPAGALLTEIGGPDVRR